MIKAVHGSGQQTMFIYTENAVIIKTDDESVVAALSNVKEAIARMDGRLEEVREAVRVALSKEIE